MANIMQQERLWGIKAEKPKSLRVKETLAGRKKRTLEVSGWGWGRDEDGDRRTSTAQQRVLGSASISCGWTVVVGQPVGHQMEFLVSEEPTPLPLLAHPVFWRLAIGRTN